ncbi:molybdopterin oxidoreductase family protein [Siccirubricoccus sp. G192]|uniref:molybdopterin oxidoreductase family protein n=1 Tax=Siccirubricoccus sp. G192 TaxID=2849651 RepID=UPI001C2C0E66|nr:molybdopterin-dependent oxidoreductase [Siccirubricoccus sp. G192]MBV1796634.1 molybdopterin-dependent oxidoreductase [Siccirubricoccus sp. G192]
MGVSRDSITDIWGPRTPYHGEGQWPVRVDERTQAEPERWVQSACVLCSNGCGLDIGVTDGRIVGVRGRAVDATNRGRLGPKGLHGWEANHSPDRLTRPLIREGGRMREAGWDEAMELLVRRSKEIRDRYTSGAIGFYTSGQLMLEEYYTLAVIGKAGLGTSHMDGNTRLCTATAAAALKETFGADGQPGSYYDIDVTDCILMVGHNMAATDTVLWSRVLDRRRGPNPPKLVVVDPRRTVVAAEADVWLAPRVGTNVALLNGLLHLLIAGGHMDREFLARHTLGFDRLAATVADYPPERVEAITGVPAAALRQAARVIGAAPTLLSTCLQGVYQSHQATAAACQVNNINLVRGLIGRPGCGILQMNGQPTSQNTRECGADGDLPGFRNWDNPTHVAELARLWNVELHTIPHWAPPTHAMEIFHHAETGSLRMLWSQATNPAVSLPALGRIRAILERPDLFVVVQDAFMTETARLADLVLPTAIWGEKTGTFTNVDRTVHLSLKAVEPPGEARADFDIFLDYARRMEFRDKDGAPLVKWQTPEECFEAWKECTRGRPCDYTGLSYAKLTGGSGIPWPCNERHPEGSPRLYTDHVFPTDPEFCEEHGHDLQTGGVITATEYRALNPAGRAFLKPTHHMPLPEAPDAEYPFLLTTGRLAHHFHTRTKTGRAEALRAAAPDAYVEISGEDAARLDVQDGDMLRLTSRRGVLEAPVRIADIHAGHLFVPFHYGYWDEPDRARAANELTIFAWDPVSKQPYFKLAAVRLEKRAAPGTVQPEDMAATRNHQGVLQAVGNAAQAALKAVESAVAPPRAHVADYLGLLLASEEMLADAFDQVKANHPKVPDVERECTVFAEWSRQAARDLRSFQDRYGTQQEGEPRRLERVLVRRHATSTGFNLLRDLHDLYLLANEGHISITILHQAAMALRDDAFERQLEAMRERNGRQRRWLETRLQQAAPQALVVPS